jgi:outer membrane protein
MREAMLKPTLRAALCSAALAAATQAQAQDTRHTIDLGLAYEYLGDATAEARSGSVVPGKRSMEFDDAYALLVRYEFALTPNIGLQLATSIGGSTTATGINGAAALGRLFKANLFSASGFVNYHFFEPTNALRPFLGVGLNYTAFSGVQSYAGQNVDIDNTWGLAAQAGVRYRIDRNWSVVGTLGTAWVKSDVSMSTAAGALRTEVDFRPVVVGIAVGYSF